jgi:uncharacterized membrane protein
MRSAVQTTPDMVPSRGLGSDPLYATLVQFPVVCFSGALVCDIAYWYSTTFLWSTFSAWLLTAGCILAVAAGTAGLYTWIRVRQVRAAPFAVFHAMLSGAVLLLSIGNVIVHSREGYTAVVPLGITLSASSVVLMLFATWFGWPRDDARVVAGQRPRAGAR